SGMARADLFGGSLGDLRAAAEDEDAVPTNRRALEQRLEEVDPGDALRDGLAEESRRPDDGLAVGRDELRPDDGRTEHLVLLDPDQLGRIQRAVLHRPALGNGPVDDRNRVVESQ